MYSAYFKTEISILFKQRIYVFWIIVRKHEFISFNGTDFPSSME
jgi:hypothetical protein